MQLLDEGVHPEYLAQMVCVNNRLKEKQALADAQNKYAMESLALNTRVTRAQIHSQYFQGTRDIREDALYKCSEMLFHIQRERRAGDTLVPGQCFVRRFTMTRAKTSIRVHFPDPGSSKHKD